MRLLHIAFFGGSIGPGEILLVLIVALLLFGAKRLPAIARSLGHALAEFKRSANNLKEDLLQESLPRESAQAKEKPDESQNPPDTTALPPDDPASPYHGSPDTDLRG